ncbi:MAG: hypothetical protein JNM57_00660 [Cyclobacteriaceae bacterium]|nr:hypothetical protein [Cyclobacteriaceae bacterium]
MLSISESPAYRGTSYEDLSHRKISVSVFSTSVVTVQQVEMLAPFLDDWFGKANWNFALDDCDHIFRIVSDGSCLDNAIQLLRDYGFICEELND